jgi:hypothetical protein
MPAKTSNRTRAALLRIGLAWGGFKASWSEAPHFASLRLGWDKNIPVIVHRCAAPRKSVSQIRPAAVTDRLQHAIDGV